MKKASIATAHFQRKPYVRPQINVVEIDGAEIICQSVGTEGYGEGNTDGWYIPS